MKEPHNYRKVGYSMIAISVSLVVIGLIVWAIGNNYHFSSELMAGQEIDAMTPKNGYNIVSFDFTAPIGSKIKYLDHTDSINETKTLQDQYLQNIKGVQILIFGNSRSANLDLTAHAEVAALTPAQGYNIILFNNAMPVGAKLTLAKNDNSLANATTYEQQQKDQIKDPDVNVIIFDSNYANNVVMVLGPGSSTTANVQLAQPTLPAISNTAPIPNTNASINNTGNESAVTAVPLNTTNNALPQTGQETLAITEQINATLTANQTTTQTTNQTDQTTNSTDKSVNLNESVGVISK
jgi:hypothetical protein